MSDEMICRYQDCRCIHERRNCVADAPLPTDEPLTMSMFLTKKDLEDAKSAARFHEFQVNSDGKTASCRKCGLKVSPRRTRICATCSGVLDEGPQPAATYEAQQSISADTLANFLWTEGLGGRTSANLSRVLLQNFAIFQKDRQEV